MQIRRPSKRTREGEIINAVDDGKGRKRRFNDERSCGGIFSHTFHLMHLSAFDCLFRSCCKSISPFCLSCIAVLHGFLVDELSFRSCLKSISPSVQHHQPISPPGFCPCKLQSCKGFFVDENCENLPYLVLVEGKDQLSVHCSGGHWRPQFEYLQHNSRNSIIVYSLPLRIMVMVAVCSTEWNRIESYRNRSREVRAKTVKD